MSYYYVWVGGLKGVVHEKDLTDKFQQYGNVLHIKVVRDQETHKSKHCALVVYGDERTAERAASGANQTYLLGSTITARGPSDQRRRGRSGVYTGRIGYVPTKDGDKRPYTDCCHHASGLCTNSPCPYRHAAVARNPTAPVCERWLGNCCTDEFCGKRHPGPNAPNSATSFSIPVQPIYSAFSGLKISDEDDIITLASKDKYDQISLKFQQDWARAKGEVPTVKAVFVIDNQELEDKWKTYKKTLPFYYQSEEDHYHGTKLCCDISSNKDLCMSPDCGICRICEDGFSEAKIRQNIPHFQRFGPGFYLAPKSSKCHDYTQGAHSYRALLLCKVAPGNKYKLKKDDTSLQGPPVSYHSIYGEAGGSLNYEEIVLPKADAILPKYIIVYRKDGVAKIAK